MKIIITDAKGVKETLDLSADATVLELKKAYRPRQSIYRKSFRTVPADGAARGNALQPDDALLTQFGFKSTGSGNKLVFKDLGPQVDYRTVFVVEYAGPLLISFLCASRPAWMYGRARSFHPVQQLYIALFIAHFIKREIETFFVHKFSHATMPMFNIVKNSVYYWSFAACIMYVLCHPKYTPPSHGFELIAAVGMALCELGNFVVHWQFSRMRKGDGDRTRNPPKGALFTLVSCPNYTFEFASWVFFSLGCNILMSWVFTLLGLLQMAQWAVKKHRGYIAQDKSFRKIKSILPFVL